MAKLIQNIFENKLQVFILILLFIGFDLDINYLSLSFDLSYLTLCLQAHVREKLEETRHSDVEQYLKNLYDLYTRYLTCSRIFFIHLQATP